MSFLNVAGKKYLITGVSNKKSVAYSVATILLENNADVVLTVQSAEHFLRVEKLFPTAKIYILDVACEKSVAAFARLLGQDNLCFDGFLHSMAFANYAAGIKPFHETSLADFNQAMNISCFSLVNLSNVLKSYLIDDASVVTVSISNTKATTYGYMGPIKSTLETSVSYLAKSFSAFSRVRFNAICSGPLKTSASAGIPNYIDNYLYAEKLTLRKMALKTKEVANSIVFLLSQASSGINASCMVIDAGMSSNYFDEEVVKVVADT